MEILVHVHLKLCHTWSGALPGDVPTAIPSKQQRRVLIALVLNNFQFCSLKAILLGNSINRFSMLGTFLFLLHSVQPNHQVCWVNVLLNVMLIAHLPRQKTSLQVFHHLITFSCFILYLSSCMCFSLTSISFSSILLFYLHLLCWSFSYSSSTGHDS